MLRASRGLWRVVRRALRAAAGTTLILGVAEVGSCLVDRDAFPHLHVYESDANLGVRLRAGASQRLATHDDARSVTQVRISREGTRGPDLPPPSEGEILLVGDSQVFGLGVEESETMSEDLARLLPHAPRVINAGVPTYGPVEYNAVVRERLAARRAVTVVYVVNFADDLFEARHSNRERHTAWGGWSVETKTPPGAFSGLPAGEILLHRSHLAFALQAYFHPNEPTMSERGLSSEAAAAELLLDARTADEDRARAAKEETTLRDDRDRATSEAEASLLAAESELESQAIRAFSPPGAPDRALLSGMLDEVYRRSREQPGDVEIEVQALELKAQAGELRYRHPRVEKRVVNATRVREEMETRIRVFAEIAAEVDEGTWRGDSNRPEAWVKAGYTGGFTRNPGMMDEVKKGRAHPLVRAFEERNRLRARLEVLRAAPLPKVVSWSPLAPLLKEVKATCDEHGARLLVVALPTRLQVSAEAPGHEGDARDVASTTRLLADLVSSAEAIGALGLDASAALVEAGPGAFLEGDGDLAPQGHAAVARAIADRLGP